MCYSSHFKNTLTSENQPFFKRMEILIFDTHRPATFRDNLSFPVYTASFPWRLLIYIVKNLWRRVLEANKNQVPLKSYSLEIRIDSVDQILKNKEKVKSTRNIVCWPQLQTGRFRVYIFMSIEQQKIEDLVRIILYVTLIIEDIFRVTL